MLHVGLMLSALFVAQPIEYNIALENRFAEAECHRYKYVEIASSNSAVTLTADGVLSKISYAGRVKLDRLCEIPNARVIDFTYQSDRSRAWVSYLDNVADLKCVPITLDPARPPILSRAATLSDGRLRLSQFVGDNLYIINPDYTHLTKSTAIAGALQPPRSQFKLPKHVVYNMCVSPDEQAIVTQGNLTKGNFIAEVWVPTRDSWTKKPVLSHSNSTFARYMHVFGKESMCMIVEMYHRGTSPPLEHYFRYELIDLRKMRILAPASITTSQPCCMALFDAELPNCVIIGEGGEVLFHDVIRNKTERVGNVESKPVCGAISISAKCMFIHTADGMTHIFSIKPK